ncbi:MAG: NADH-quinone oxidoreductase subunit H [Staphylothermus sp.]|nr:NADH-quinone oxidoreductase subunit H [Staphylothermus sp.]
MWLDISLTIILLLIMLILPPVLDGIERKIRAKIHSRIGPPSIMQTWYDIRKLFAKELVVTDTGYIMFFIAITLFSMTILALFLLPTGFMNIFSRDNISLLLFSIFILAIQLIWMLLSVAPSNPYSTIGVFREALLGMVNELFFMLGLFALLVYVNGLSFTHLISTSYSITYVLILLLLASYAYVSSGRIPFDIAEAEPELASGILIEFSGPLLGMVLYSNLVKRAILYGFVANLIILPLLGELNLLLKILLFFISLLIIWIIYSVTSIIFARTRVDLAPKTLFFFYLLVTILITITWLLRV